jgi:PAS domain S-box-containing protein
MHSSKPSELQRTFDRPHTRVDRALGDRRGTEEDEEQPGAPESEIDADELLRATFQRAGVGIGDMTLDGHWLRVNDRLCHLLGRTEDELRAQSFMQFIQSGNRQGTLLAWAQSAGTEGDTYSAEHRFVSGDGTMVWTKVTASVALDATRQGKYLVLVIEDITDRIRVEEALQEDLERMVTEHTEELCEVNDELQHEMAERQAVQKALWDREERHRKLLESTSVIPWEADVERTRFSYVGPQAIQLLGYPVTDWHRENFWIDHVWPEDRERALQCAAEAVGQMKDSEFEYRMVASDGRASWLREIVSVVCEDGQAVLLRGFMLDITERKQAEAARMQLASIVDSSDDAIIGKTLDGIITSWNAAAERIYGYSAGEIVRKHISVLAPAHWVDEVPGLLEKIRDGEKVRRCETVRRTKIGQLIDVALTISPVMDASGKVIGASTIARDITDRKCAELALRRNEHELSDFFDNAPVGLHWLGPDGIVLRANSATLHLLGYRHEEYVGHSIAEFHMDHGVAEDMLVRLLKNETLRNYEARLRARDGSVRHVLINSNVRWEDGRFVHSRCFIQDITTRRNLEKELLNISDREQGRIGQDLHDDLCQQLAGIGLLSQVLGQNLERKNAKAEADRATQISKHLDDAIKHTRMLARGLAPVSLQAYGLPCALEELAVNTQHMFRIACEFVGDQSISVKDTANATHLYRIAQEAISNAIRHGKSSEVTVTLVPDGEYARLTISDNGQGFATKQREQSKGMGLRIMNYRASMIGGSLDISRGDDKGTVVTCIFTRDL